MKFNLATISRLHFIGIHGVGVSGVAFICHQMGKEVKGSDKPHDQIYGDKAELFEKNGIEVFYGFDAANLNWDPEAVIVGMSFSDDNPELEEAKRKNIPIITESEVRGLLMKEKKGIAVSGVHGKTTTTALLSYIFMKADKDPTFLIGTNNIPNLGTHAHFGQGEYVIIEADEYQKSKNDNTPKMLDLSPTIVITTSVEWEHVDMYKDEAEVEAAFSKLVEKIPSQGYWVCCYDWPAIQRILKQITVTRETYGFSPHAAWRVGKVEYEKEGMKFDVLKDGKYFDTFYTPLSGKHNALNALACIIVALREGIPIFSIKDSIKNFIGSERRFEINMKDDIIFIDDYAHHPTEIRATLAAARERYPEREMWCVYQPHMVSRTYHLKKDIAQSFKDCDHLVITDIFTSAREKVDLITTSELFEETVRYHDDVVYTGNLEDTEKYLKFKIKKGDVLITMGAGDVYKIRNALVGE